MLVLTVYRSPKKEGMYLYVDKSEDLKRVPETLLSIFGEPEFALTLALTPERKLALADPAQVKNSIEEQGYYLQMPPGKDAYLLDLYDPEAEAKAQVIAAQENPN